MSLIHVMMMKRKERKKMTMKLSEALKDKSFRQKVANYGRKFKPDLDPPIIYKGKLFRMKQQLMTAIKKDYSILTKAISQKAYEWSFKYAFNFAITKNVQNIVQEVVMSIDKEEKLILTVYHKGLHFDVADNVPLADVLLDIETKIKELKNGKTKESTKKS